MDFTIFEEDDKYLIILANEDVTIKFHIAKDETERLINELSNLDNANFLAYFKHCSIFGFTSERYYEIVVAHKKMFSDYISMNVVKSDMNRFVSRFRAMVLA